MDRQIDIQDLFQKKVSREEMRLQVYDKVLERVHKRIKLAASVDGGGTFTTFTLPEVMIGQPLFNASQCRSYVVTSLAKNGFRVKYTHPNFLMISWDHLRSQYEKATEVISREQQELIDKKNQILQDKAREEEERLNRAYMEQRRTFGGMNGVSTNLNPETRTPAETRRLVRAAEDYVPSGQLRDVYFNRKN
jgi:ElaB/YqjD/DUF883 family membrane-anchored ribosome-binding protein